MPTTKSAAKSIKTSEKKRLANKSVKSRIASIRKKLDEAIAKKDKVKSQEMLRTYRSALDKAVKTSVIKANAASRKISRATLKIAAL